MGLKSNKKRCKTIKLLGVVILHKGLYLVFFTVLFSLLNLSALYAQQGKTISGKVTDVSGEPLPGLTVVVKGTTQGTVTDADGNYSMVNVSPGSALVFSFVGMKTQEIEVGTQSKIDVTMVVDAIGIEEVVAVGYGTQKKVNLTGSVTTIDADEISEVPMANVGQALTGKVPGLFTRQNQGIPGNDNTQLSIRGYGSPLVLVDGIESDWTRLDPNEISSISILKDASAAIYGARAGNGVVLITTKRGTVEKPTITYTGDVSFQEPTILPQWVDSWQYAELLREGEFNQDLNYTFTEEEVQIFKDGNNPDYPNTDWHEEIFRHWAPMHTHNLGVSGGSENVKYYVSAGYMNQGSLYDSGDLNFTRYNIRSNIDVNITEGLVTSLDMAYRMELRDQPETGLGDTWIDLNLAKPYYPATIPDPELGAAYAGFNVRSPLAQTQKRYTGFTDDRREFITGKINLAYEIPGIEGLVANARLNFLFNDTYVKTQDKPFEVLEYNYESETYSSLGVNGRNTLTESSARYSQFYPMVTMNYDRTFGEHTVGGLFVAEWIDTERIYYEAGKFDLLSLDLPYLFAGSPDNVTANGYTTETGRASYISRLNYSYMGKYLLEGTIRFDASHKFPKESRWGFFPSVSAGWRISEESFMDGFSGLDNLKLRVSYSQAGLDNVAAFRYLTGYRVRTGVYPDVPDATELYIFGSDAYRLITPTGLPNPDITWLDMTSYNVGLDGSFYGGLIGFEIDLFYRITDNIFGQPLESYPSTFGAILPELNLNSTDDRGFEILLTHRNRVTSDFSYSIEGMFSLAREKYRNWSEPEYDDPDEIRIFKNEGNYTNRRIGYISDGIFMSQAEIDEHPVDQDQSGNVTLMPGDIKYIDLNGDGVLNWRDQDVIGYSNFPDISYGLKLSSTYKGLGLSALLQGASMFDMYNQIHPFVNFSKPWDFHMKYRWQPDPDDKTININPDAKLPALLGDGVGRNPNNEKTSDFWVQDATYIRLKQLTLTYSLPGKWMNDLGFQNVQLNISGTNLFTISRMGIYKNSIDPEAVGNVGRLYPPVKTLSIGLRVTI
jgi:TonB-linked SusC/RagA family outer membrane protein